MIIATEAHDGKSCHLGFGINVTRGDTSKANQNRDYRIFEEFAYFVIDQARAKRINDVLKIGGNVYAFDSTAIDFCLSVFWWIIFRKTKGEIKVHTLYDLETQIPAFFHITIASVHDMTVMDKFPINQVLIISLIEDTMITSGSITSIR